MSVQPRLYLLLWRLQNRLERRRRLPWLGRWLRGARQLLFPRDFLTGLHNRPAVLSRAEVALAARRIGAVLTVDVDRFRCLNHACGYLDGDDYLRHLAALVQDAAAGRLCGRLGGEEFVVFTEPGPSADELAEQIRLRVQTDARFETMRVQLLPEYGDYSPLLTVSIGVAHAEPGASFRELLETSYDALSEAKNAGRNCVVRASRLLKIDE